VGVFIGHVPIYGLQSVAAIGLAVLFRLNKPLTFAATFVNNPLFQPFMVAGSLELGHLILTGRLWRFALPQMTIQTLKADLAAWLVGSVALGAIIGGMAALGILFLLRFRARRTREAPHRRDSVNRLFAEAPWRDRGFVRWKIRLDRIFDYLPPEDLGTGCAVDLGCGYGIALGFAALEDPSRRLAGCDLNGRRIAVARRALTGRNAILTVCDVRHFDLPRAGLVLILDVLQYLAADEQMELLARCSAALDPGGKLVFRVHDRERGILWRFTSAFDRLIFLADRNGLRPVTLPVARYRRALEVAGMTIVERRFRNRLPLAHILIVATKSPTAEART
jgi:SAM-dependent methyltransferase